MQTIVRESVMVHRCQIGVRQLQLSVAEPLPRYEASNRVRSIDAALAFGPQKQLFLRLHLASPAFTPILIRGLDELAEQGMRLQWL